MIDQKTIEEIRSKLKREKSLTEKELGRFAERDKKTKGDWDTKYPFFNGQETGSAALEKAADEVEEYETRLPIGQAFVKKLKNINLALEKIKKGKYGICEKCKKPISAKRLKISPEARLCIKCQSK